MPLPFYLHTDLLFLLSCTECQTCVSAELSELVYLPGLRDRTDRHQCCYPFYVHGLVAVAVFRQYIKRRYNTCVSTSFPEFLTGTKGKNYPFYVYRPVLFSVLHCIANGTKGKRSPFYVHRPVCLISTNTGTVSLTCTNRLGTCRYPQRDIEQRYRV